MIKFNRIIFGVTLMIFTGCSSNEESNSDEMSSNSNVKGAELIDQKCTMCHSGHSEVIIAPPFKAIQHKYTKEFKEKDKFVKAVVNFVSNPVEENIIMKGAFNKFGPMQKLELSDAELLAIAEYLYQGDFKGVDDQNKQESEQDPISKGKDYALKAKSVLGKNLMGQIKDNGTEAALDFCCLNAQPLTDSIANLNVASIKRVSDLNRNAQNYADQTELEYILDTKEIIKLGGVPKPNLIEVDNSYKAYYPILTDQRCLQCHGEKESQIKSSTLSAIAERYPNDMATGFKEGDLRGIWVIEWSK